MKITSFEEYGLRCLVQLTLHRSENRPIAISEIAKAEGLSVQYVGKLMHELRRGGLIKSLRGIHGGFVLAREPEAISIAEIFKAMGGETPEHVCTKFTGNLNECIHMGSCSIRSVWAFVMNQVSEVLEKISLADLVLSEEASKAKFKQFQTTMPAHPAL